MRNCSDFYLILDPRIKLIWFDKSRAWVWVWKLSSEDYSRISWCNVLNSSHYDDVIMDEIASQITSLTIVYSAVYLDADQRKHQSSASLAFVRGIHRGPVNSPHKWPITRKMFPFDDVIMQTVILYKWVYSSSSYMHTKFHKSKFTFIWCQLYFPSGNVYYHYRCYSGEIIKII